MSSEPHSGEVQHHKPKHLAEKFEGILPMVMIVAVVILAVGLIYGLLTTDNTPTWMK